jgi:hypothetical protein
MPWQAARMGIRPVVLGLAALVALTGCNDDDGADAGQQPTTDAECARVIPDGVFTTLGWTPTEEGAEATVRGCHREAEQGYVEVRDRTGYDQLCATLDRTGGVGPGTPVDWLGEGVTACAVEPQADVGQTKVVVKGDGNAVTQVTIAVLASTPQAKVRAAVAELVS